MNALSAVKQQFLVVKLLAHVCGCRLIKRKVKPSIDLAYLYKLAQGKPTFVDFAEVECVVITFVLDDSLWDSYVVLRVLRCCCWQQKGE